MVVRPDYAPLGSLPILCRRGRDQPVSNTYSVAAGVRRLAIRYERRAKIYLASMALACAITC